jgi:uncharacterized protein
MKMMRLVAVAAVLLAAGPVAPAGAQEIQLDTEYEGIPLEDVTDEHMQLARQTVAATKMTRPFDLLLPEIADRAKTTFIRSNPQMQLGIIDVVDRVALDIVERRGQLEEMVAEIWATSFTEEELREILAFYRTPLGRKYADLFPELLRAPMGAAELWGAVISEDLYNRVVRDLQRMAEEEGQRLQGLPAPPEPPTQSLEGLQINPPAN